MTLEWPPTRRLDGPGGPRETRSQIRGRITTAARRVATGALDAAERRLGVAERLADGGNAVLVYHAVGDPDRFGNVSPERLLRDLAYLSTHFEVVDLPTVLDRPDADRKRVAVTFDDAYRSVLTHALPVVRDLAVPVTVFVPVGFVDRARPSLAYRFVADPVADDAFNDPARAEQPARVPDPGVVDPGGLADFVAEPLVTLGNHTLTHPDLARIDDARLLGAEIREARDRLEAHAGVTIDRFAFPYGRYSEAALDVVRDTHEYAVTTRPGLVGPNADPHRLPRIDAAVDHHRVRWRVAGGPHAWVPGR